MLGNLKLERSIIESQKSLSRNYRKNFINESRFYSQDLNTQVSFTGKLFLSFSDKLKKFKYSRTNFKTRKPMGSRKLYWKYSEKLQLRN